MPGLYERNSNFGESINLKISARGFFYESKKNVPDVVDEQIRRLYEEEGYREYETVQGKKVWWKCYKGVAGKVVHVGVRTFQGSMGQPVTNFSIGLNVGDKTCFISTPLYNQKGGLNGYVKDFVKYYNNIDFSRNIYIAPSSPKTGEEYGSNSFFIGYEVEGSDIQLIPRYYKNGQNGWPETVKYESLGKTVTDSRVQDQFAYERLSEYLKDFEAKYKTKKDNAGNYSTSSSMPEQAARSNAPQSFQQGGQVLGHQGNQPSPQLGNSQPAQPNQTPAFQNPNPVTVPPKSYDDDLPF